MSRLCLLLTSSITVDHPEFLRKTGRLDAGERLSDSLSALRWWLTRQDSVKDIIFIDNSGHPLDELRDLAEGQRDKDRRVEFLSFKTQGYSRARGRSFGELDILSHGLEHSSLLKTCTHFAKVNSRVFVPNFDALVKRLPTDFDIVGTLSHNLTWLDTVLVFFRTAVFADHILPEALRQVDDSRRLYLERVMAKQTLRCIADDYRWYPFPREPLLHGVRGLDSRPYPKSRLRAALVDLFGWGFNRARDTSRNRQVPHAQDRWSE